MKGKHAMLCAGAVFLLIASNTLVLQTHYRSTHIACYGFNSSTNGKQQLNSKLSLSLDGHRGQFIFDGFFTDKVGTSNNLHVASAFSFTQFANTYTITDVSVSEFYDNKVKHEDIKGLSPILMSLNGGDFIMNIYPIGKAAYLIMNDKLLYMYCYK
jgi:hypothetical protein